MRKILHHTKKYDGSVHYRFPAKLAHLTENTLIIYRGPDIELESYRGPMVSDGQLLLFFYKNRYHNVAILWDRDWTPHMHYINIATPADWNEKKVNAVDLDLDIIRFAGSDEVHIDDEDEFERHIGVYSYPQKLVDSCQEELGRVNSAVTERLGVFSDAIYQWRPGEPFLDEFIAPC